MSLKKIIQHQLEVFKEYRERRLAAFDHPGIRLWARVTIAATVIPFGYVHMTAPVGFFGARMALGAVGMLCAWRLMFAFWSECARILLVLSLNSYYILSLTSLFLHDNMLSNTTTAIAFLPAIILINSVTSNTAYSVYLNSFQFLYASVPFSIYLFGPSAQTGWNIDKTSAVHVMSVAFASIFLTHFSTLVARSMAESLEKARSEVKEVQMNQVLEREREKFRSDLAQMNRVLIIETMTTTLTHEISQPINSTSVFVGAIKRWLKGASVNVAEALIAAEKASVQVDRAREIVEAVRGFARKGGQDYRHIDLSECVDDVLMLMHKEFTFRGIRVDFEKSYPGSPIVVIARKHEVEQIIANILLNSIEAMVHPTGDLVIKIRFLTSNSGVDLQIIDNGEGLPENVEDELFSKFFTTKDKGTGLGLSISMELAEKFGGRLTLKARPEGGAIATLRLPLARPGAHPSIDESGST